MTGTQFHSGHRECTFGTHGIQRLVKNVRHTGECVVARNPLLCIHEFENCMAPAKTFGVSALRSVSAAEKNLGAVSGGVEIISRTMCRQRTLLLNVGYQWRSICEPNNVNDLGGCHLGACRHRIH